jgi:hypothetical protein
MLTNLTNRFLTRRKTGSDSVPPDCAKSPAIGSESIVRKADRWLEHHTAQEHAELLLEWIQLNMDLGHRLLFREALQEFYAEAVNEAGWAARPWNPISRQLDLMCTGGRKPYTWTMTPTGRMKRRRYYPIPIASQSLVQRQDRQAAT